MIEQVWLFSAALSLGIALLGGWRALAVAAIALVILCVAGLVVAPRGIHPDYWSFEKGWDHALGILGMYGVLVGPSAIGAGGLVGLGLRSIANHARLAKGKQGQKP